MTSSGFKVNPDRLQFSVYGREGVLDIERFGAFLQLLDALGTTPEWIRQGKKKRRYSRPAFAELLDAAREEPRVFFTLGRDSAIPVDFGFAIYREATTQGGFAVDGSLPWVFLAAEDRAFMFADRLGPALASFGIIFGRCVSLAELVEINRTQRESRDWEPQAIDEVFWLNWYGSNLVARLGRDRVLSTPAFMMRELPDGSVLWTTRPGPADFASDDARIAQARARAHLVDGVSFDAELARLRQRSARLAPVEPTWPDELDPLFSRITNTDPPEQFQLAAKLNELQVPPVTEWRLASEVVANVDDPDVLEEYDLYAERLIALVHDHVEDIGKFSVETIPALDEYVWRARLAEAAPREVIEGDLVPAVGGYVGELLRRRFGGRWVPRRNLDEAAVVIGDRAWLPFARTRKYLASRDGALTHSLTQFVRAVG